MTAIEVTDENINTILAPAKPLLLDFSAEWCGSCKMMSLIVESIANAITISRRRTGTFNNGNF